MPLLNENIDRCFVVNYYSKFDKTYNFIISEYAEDLYTPESLLKGAVNDLKTHKQYIEFTIDDIKIPVIADANINKRIVTYPSIAEE